MDAFERIGSLLFLLAFVMLTCGQTSYPPELQDCTDPACRRMNSTDGLPPGVGNVPPPPVGGSADVGTGAGAGVGGVAGQTGAATSVGGVGGALGGFGGMAGSGLGGGGFTGGAGGSP